MLSLERWHSHAKTSCPVLVQQVGCRWGAVFALQARRAERSLQVHEIIAVLGLREVDAGKPSHVVLSGWRALLNTERVEASIALPPAMGGSQIT